MRGIVALYVWLFRGTPMMVQAMVIYYGAAQLLGWDMDPLWAGLFIVSINTGAYMSETMRGGIQSVDAGQDEGAEAIGMGRGQTMFLVILPQAFRSIIPQVGNYLISNIKDTSMLSVITVGELFYRGREAAGQYFRFFEVFLIVSCIYLFMTTVATLLLRLVEKNYLALRITICVTTADERSFIMTACCNLAMPIPRQKAAEAAAETTSAAISVQHLQMSFGTHQVLRDVDFTVRQGMLSASSAPPAQASPPCFDASTIWSVPLAAPFTIRDSPWAASGLIFPRYRAKVEWYSNLLISSTICLF